MNPGKANNQKSKEIEDVLEESIRLSKDAVRANKQHFEMLVATSGLCEILPSIRQAIDFMREDGFADMYEARQWLEGGEGDRRKRELAGWIRAICSEFQLTENFQSTVERYVLTGQISAPGNYSIKVDFVNKRISTVEYALAAGKEKKALRIIKQKLTEMLERSIGRTNKQIKLTDRSIHERDLKILELSRKGFSNEEIVQELVPDDESEEATKEQKAMKKIVKDVLYNRLKRGRNN